MGCSKDIQGAKNPPVNTCQSIRLTCRVEYVPIYYVLYLEYLHVVPCYSNEFKGLNSRGREQAASDKTTCSQDNPLLSAASQGRCKARDLAI